MSKNIIRSLVLSLLSCCMLPPQMAVAQDCSRGSRIAKSAVGGAVLGGLIGGLVGGNRKGLLIGAGAGSGTGALAAIATPGPCRNYPHPTQPPRPAPIAQQAAGSYNNQIASADAPKAILSDHTILLRDTSGAERAALCPILTQAVANKGYVLLDCNGNFTADNAEWIMDLIIRQISGSNGYGGGGVSYASFNANGNGMQTSGDYQIEITMIDAKTGRTDPTRTRVMKIHSKLYTSGNGYMTVSNVYGYGSHQYYANDPMTGAAEEAVNFFFGATQ